MEKASFFILHVFLQDLGSEGNGVGVAEIDFQRLDSVRTAMPIESHRRYILPGTL